MRKPELLAPAGNLERLKIAVHYGADAVYVGGKQFGLRAFADNFTVEELIEGIKYAHEYKVKVYVTLNMIPHNDDLDGLEDYVARLEKAGADAFIVSDPGVFNIVRETAPEAEIHISTQANNTNWKSAQFWHTLGAKRIVLARELSLKEVATIRDRSPETLEFEIFVHGAMCISYSGRCLLSNYLTHRDANRGECAQPCRWKYFLMEETRPGEYMPIFEDQKGTYIYNSKDLMMLEYIPQLVEAGVSSFKIEGRMKTSFYVATVVKAYRNAIDQYFSNPTSYEFDPSLILEIGKASHREFTTGFYFDKPGIDAQQYDLCRYLREYEFVGMVLGYDDEKKEAIVEQRNRFFLSDELEILSPTLPNKTFIVEQIRNENEELQDSASHPQQIIRIPCAYHLEKYDILRKKM